jgi:hypothetical protein
MSVAIGPTSLDWPAWVQAIGSVAAIVTSGWIARRDGQIRREDRDDDRRQKELTSLEAQVRFARHVGEQVRACYDLIEHQLSGLAGLLPSWIETIPALLLNGPMS